MMLSDLWNEVKGAAEHAVALLETEARAVLARSVAVAEPQVAADLSQLKQLAIRQAIELGSEGAADISHGEMVHKVYDALLCEAETKDLPLAEHHVYMLAEHAVQAVALAAANQAPVPIPAPPPPAPPPAPEPPLTPVADPPA